MTFLSAMFGWAVREGWMAHNPVARLRVGERAAPEGKRAPFSNEQLQAIFSEPPWSPRDARSEEHTSELQSLMRISYAVFCLKKKTNEYHRAEQTHKKHNE